MEKRFFILFSTALLLISVCPAKALNHAFIWNSSTGMVDLGTLPDGQDSFARAINDNGQVAGYAYLSDGVTTHAFIWTEATGMVDIGTPGGDYCAPFAMNSSGAIAGQGSLANGKEVAFYWTSTGGFVTLREPRESTTAIDINDAGDIAGFRYESGVADFRYSPAASREGFAWNPISGTSRGLGLFTGGDSSLGLGINNLRHITGGATLSNFAEHVFLWKKRTGLIDLGTPPGVVNAEATAINDQDEIVGNDSNTSAQPFYWSESTGYRILGKFGSQVTVTSINNAGQIVGTSEISTSATFHAVLWPDSLSAPQDLGTLPGGTFSRANSINNLAQVVGFSDLTAK